MCFSNVSKTKAERPSVWPQAVRLAYFMTYGRTNGRTNAGTLLNGLAALVLGAL